MLFNPPRTKRHTLSRPIVVNGKGFPKDGVELFHCGEDVTIQTDNGHEWYVLGHYKGKGIRIRIALSTV